jgi:hypothetical protein
MSNFTHELINSLQNLDSAKLVRCTVIAINHATNTANVELGEMPPSGVPARELTDIDCIDIPIFAGDGWSDDGMRRVFNNVPIYYHCQGSTGTVAELITGCKAFKVPVAELSSPPNSQQEVDNNHINVIREKVLLLFIPPTAEEYTAGIEGYRYIIGHTDRNDIAPCKSEFICMRLIHRFDLTTYVFDPIFPQQMIWNPNFGYALDIDSVVIHILDPIGNRVYKGLEPYGITFPCLIQDILDKSQAIVINDQTPLEDIAFLDALYTMNALYEQSFILQQPYYTLDGYVVGGANNHIYEPTIDCNNWHPTKLCWMQHFFDPGLQCEILSTDPRTFNEPWGTVRFHYDYHASPGTHPNDIYLVNRHYAVYPNFDYYQVFTTYGPYATALPDIVTYDYTSPVLGHQNYADTRGLYGWFVSGPGEGAIQINFVLSNIASVGGNSTVSLAFYHPSSSAPWFSDSFIGRVNSLGHYSGYPNPYFTVEQEFSLSVHGEALMVGTSATYGMHVAIYYYAGFSYTEYGMPETFSIDLTKCKIKANFSINPFFWKGNDYAAHSVKDPRNLASLPGASSFCEQELLKMWDMYVEARAPYDYWLSSDTRWYSKAHFSAFVMNVVE